MPPRNTRTSSSFIHSAPQYTLSNTRESYRDLLIFEERLKQNSARLKGQRRKYEAFLLSLVLSILLLAYRVFLVPSPYTLVQFLNSGLLLIGIVTLILFFATGVYTEKIAYAYKFVPQANRALRYFNIYLNTKQPPRTWSHNPFRLFRSSPSSQPANTALARSTSNSSNNSRSSSPRSSKSSSSGGGGRTTSIPITPRAPSNNPRGELIFSSKVGPGFREGYEKYRNEWEKRRKPSRVELSWWNWLKGFVVTSSTSEGRSAKSAEKVEKHVQQTEKEISSTTTLSNSQQTRTSTSSSINSDSRGRDIRTRPLLRTVSSASSNSSASSSAYSVSPPASRQPSPLRNPVVDDVSKTSSPTSSRRSTPDLITEEDEEYFMEEKGRKGVGSNSESSLASLGRQDRRSIDVTGETDEDGWTRQKVRNRGKAL